MIEITVHIPSLDRLTEVLKDGGFSTAGLTEGSTEPVEAPPAKKKATVEAPPAKKKAKVEAPPAKKKAKVEPVEEDPTHNVEDLKALAGKVIEASNVKTLRSALDAAGLPNSGAGSKVSDCDPKFYGAIHEKLTEALDLAAAV